MELSEKHFVIFGGAGFIGSHVVSLLAREPVERIVVFDKVVRRENLAPALASGKVKVVEGDVTQADQVAAVMDGMDGVFHLAALPINSCVKMPRSCIEINVLGTFNVFEAAHKAGVRKSQIAASRPRGACLRGSAVTTGAANRPGLVLL